jgi:uncharacterized membrane protein
MLSSEKPFYTKKEITLEVIGILAIFTFLIFTFFNWPDVPQRIPTHFNWSGIPDSWGSKGTVPIMIYVTVFIFILFTVISRFPRRINFPISIKEENSKSHIQLRFSLIIWIKAELLLILSYIGIQGIRVSLGYAEGLGSLLIPMILVIIFGTSAIFIYRAYKL